MVSILSPKLERPVNMRRPMAAQNGTLIGIELALHRAESYLLAGWQLTPEQALRIFGSGDSPDSPDRPSQNSCRHCAEEDEVNDTSAFFGDDSESRPLS